MAGVKIYTKVQTKRVHTELPILYSMKETILLLTLTAKYKN